MPYAQFKPSIWSKSINLALRKSLVARMLVNTDYEGEISSAGSVVKINRPSSITVSDYTGSDMDVQVPTATQLELVIDKAKYFNFQVDDVDKIQTNVDLMKTYIAEANYALTGIVDSDVLQYLAQNNHADNASGTVTLAANNIYEKAVEAMEKLNLKDVPLEGRYLVLSPREHALITRSTQFIPATALGDEVVRSGVVGKIAGFNLLISNNLYTETNSTAGISSGQPLHRYLVYAHSMSTTMATQINKVEAYRTEKRFADGIKGLCLYGIKTIKPEALGIIKNQIGTKP